MSISKDEYDAVLQSLVRAEHWIDAQLESLSVPETNEKTNSDGFRTVDSTAFDDSNTLPEQDVYKRQAFCFVLCLTDFIIQLGCFTTISFYHIVPQMSTFP